MRKPDVLTEQDLANIEAVERGDMTAEDYIDDSERRMAARHSRRQRRHNESVYMELHYVDGVTHWGYVPKEKAAGYAEFVRFHANAGHPGQSHTSDGRMQFERAFGYDQYHESNRRYDGDYLTPLAKKLYDFPSKTLDISRLYGRINAEGVSI